jgi:hypothetical protein
VTGRHRLVVMVLSAVLASGCAAPDGGTSAPAVVTDSASAVPDGAPAEPVAPPLLAPSVQDPKDARGISACDLLTDGQLTELNLVPGSGEETASGRTRTCRWSSALDDTNPAGLDVLDDSATAPLDFIYRLRETSEVWEELVIGGHPAVRQDQYDDNDCTIYVAISDYQAVSTTGNTARRDLPDPCAVSRRMAEFVLSNLPPLR